MAARGHCSRILLVPSGVFGRERTVTNFIETLSILSHMRPIYTMHFGGNDDDGIIKPYCRPPELAARPRHNLLTIRDDTEHISFDRRIVNDKNTTRTEQ